MRDQKETETILGNGISATVLIMITCLVGTMITANSGIVQGFFWLLPCVPDGIKSG